MNRATRWNSAWGFGALACTQWCSWDGGWGGIASAQNAAETRQIPTADLAQFDEAEANRVKAIELNEQGRGAEAVAPAQAAAAVYKRLFGEGDSLYFDALREVGRAYLAMGDYARAEAAYLQYQDVVRRTKGAASVEYAGALNNLASVYKARGEYDLAEPMFVEALKVTEATVGEKDRLYNAVLNNLANLREFQGDYGQAASLYQRVLEILKETEGEQSLDYATTTNNLAMVYYKIQDFASAEPLFQQAIRIDQTVIGKHHPLYAVDLQNLASLYLAMGDADRAEPYYRLSLDIIMAHSDAMAMAQDEAGQLATANNFKAYLGFYLNCVLRQSAGRADAAYEALLRWKGATLVRQRAAHAAAESPELAPKLAELQAVVREWAALSAGAPADDAAAQQRLEELAGRKDALEVELSRGSATILQALEPPTIARLQAALPEDAALVDFVQYFHPAWDELPQAAGLGIAIQVVEGGVHIDSLLEGGAAALDGRLQAGDVITAVAEGEGELQSLAGLPVDQATALLRGAVDSTARLQVRRAADGAGAAKELEYAVKRTVLPGQLRKQFRTTMSLAAFVIRRNRPVQLFDLSHTYYVYEAIDQWQATRGASADAKKAGAFLRATLWDPLAAAVGDAKLVLISPDGALGMFPFAALPGSRPDAYLIEDVPLAMVPVPQLLPAMMSADEAKPLTIEMLVLGGVDYDRHGDAAPAPQTGNSAIVRPWERRRMELAQRSGIADGRWPFLPGTDSESSFIRDLYFDATGLPRESNRVVALRGAAATEEAFRRLAPQAYLLHLATHGFFNGEGQDSALATIKRATVVKGYGPDDPGLLSGLVLGGANVGPTGSENSAAQATWADDGYLTAEEIAAMSLGGAQLVVLSACESGLGRATGGEGMLGIQRAFQVAGARATIASLWKVNDEATRRIMEEFYRNFLVKQMSPLEALRAAQMWALNNPALVPRGADAPADAQALTRLPPQFWAAFTLSGDWR